MLVYFVLEGTFPLLVLTLLGSLSDASLVELILVIDVEEHST